MEMKYVAPEVEIVETLVEVGFSASGTSGEVTPPSVGDDDWV